MFKKFFWVIIESTSTVFFQFISVVILARLLTPHDYGIIGMMTIFIAIGTMIVDSGMGSAVVKKENVSNVDFSTLFIYNLLISALLYLTLYFLSPVIARYYNTPELNSLIRLLSLVIVISALGIVQNAKLLRELKFKQLAVISVVANLLSLIVGILLAKNGHGVNALIYQQLSLIFIRTLLTASISRFVPKMLFSIESFKYQFSFGVNILLSNFLNTIYLNLSSALIPKIGSIAQNGFYVQANKIQNVPLSIIAMLSDKAIFPILAKYNEKEILIQNARIIIRYVYLIAFPVIAFCSLLSTPIVLLVLGENWIDSAIYLQILFIAGFGTCIAHLGRNIIKSYGDTVRIFHLGIIKTIIGISILLLSMRFGVIFLMYGIVISSSVLAIITMHFLSRHLDYSLKEQLKDLKEPAFLTISSYLILMAFVKFYSMNSIWDLTYIIIGFLCYLLLGLLIKNTEIRDMATLLLKYLST